MFHNGSPGGDVRTAGRRRAAWAAVGLAVIVAALGLWWRAASPRAAVPPDDEWQPPPVRNPGYTGMHACAPCHAARVAEFAKTRHALACCEPRPDAMPAGFAPGRGTFASRLPDLRFEMRRQGGDFIQTALHGPQRTPARIALVYGSGGTADEVFFTWHGDRLYELPVAWLHPKNGWAEEPRSRYSSGDFTRTTTPRCLECHNTWLEHVPGTENEYRRDTFLLGVTCERCHGPGREHVEYHQAHPKADSAHAIVHPGDLTRERRMDLCGQCHSNTTKRRGPAFSYRPGESLADHFRTAQVRHREEDHVADQVKYLRQSKCFQKSDTLDCMTCHDPHRRDTQGAARGSCRKCHEPAACTDRERQPVAVRENCVACHMPQFTRIQVLFHTEDDRYVPAIRPYDHRIAVHPEARQEVLLAWHRSQSDAASRAEAERLAAELVERRLAAAETFRREYRFLAAIAAVRDALRVSPTPAVRAKLEELVAIQAEIDAGRDEASHLSDTRRFPEAIEVLQRILKLKPDLALAHGKLGTLYAVSGKNDLAREHLQTAARCDPDDSYGDSMLGWLAYLQGRPEEAVAAYRRADEIEPFNAKINHHLGLALVRLERLPEAIEHFRKVLAIDPNHVGGCLALGEALRRQGNAAEALGFVRRAARLTRFQNADALVLLAEVYADVGRTAQAAETVQQALALEEGALTPELRRRVDEVRARVRR